jgi:acetyltransferase-like isoleucine patch superfamily enzyme
MQTEIEKCMNGEWYDCHDPVFMAFKANARRLLARYNSLSYNDRTNRDKLLNELFGNVGSNVSVGNPFVCDYGRNIHIGNNVSVNMNCTFIDCNKITIGNNVLIASNVQIYTAAHPVELADRLTPDWHEGSSQYFCKTFALPVAIEDGCWIGGGVIIIPGVTIGKGSVIGAGSVVTKDIPANSLAVGNPCRVIRKLNKEHNNG